jgi:16S rRNA processing protein RimM
VKKIKIGRITGAQGLRGEVKMFHDSGEAEALERLTSLFLKGEGGSETGSEPELAEYVIENLRMHKRTPIFKLNGIENRDSAEALIGFDVYTNEDESRPEGEDAWFASDLVGMKVRIASSPSAPRYDGEYLVKSIISNPAHDILEIETPYGIKMLPFIDVFIHKVDINTGYITIIPPEGWLD